MMNRELSRRRLLGGAVAAAAGGMLLNFGSSEASQAGRRAGRNAKPREMGKPVLSACIEAVFKSKPAENSLDKVKAVGLTAYEFWGFGNKDLDAMAAKAKALGLKTAIFSCQTGGALVAPGSEKGFVEGAKKSIAAAKKIDCDRLIATVGQERNDISREAQHANIVKACKAVAPLFEEAGILLCLEPLNVLVNHKGYFLYSSKEAFEIVDEVGSENVKILFDIYHQQITEGNVINNIRNNIDKIGHFHVADVPGRHEPGTGEINYKNVFRAIARAGYNGYLGLEMWPTGDNAEAVKGTMDIFAEAMKA